MSDILNEDTRTKTEPVAPAALAETRHAETLPEEEAAKAPIAAARPAVSAALNKPEGASYNRGRQRTGMPIAETIFGRDTDLEISSESQNANLLFREHLGENVHASETLKSMRDVLRIFLSYAPRTFVSKCIDGRVHGSKGKGYPPTTVMFSRTEGNNVDLSPANSLYWNRLASVVLDAERHTPECPALFIALGHRAEAGHGCAAHREDNDAALIAVRTQAEGVRERYRPYQLYALYGMTNTDDGSERLIFADGHELDTTKIIAHLNTDAMPLRSVTDVFDPRFLDSPLDDKMVHRLIGGRKPLEIMTGTSPIMFNDLQAGVGMEAYLIREISMITRNQSRNNVVFNQRLFDYIRGILDAISDLPEQLKAALLYQTLWNIAYTLYRRAKISSIEEDQSRELELEHGETMVAYGEGFEIENRNRLVLVKPGRGDDQEALAVAKHVLLSSRNKRGKQEHPPVVHINVEVAGIMDSWDAFDKNILGKLHTMVHNVHAVFGEDCRVLTTYSYVREKRFYPVQLPARASETDERESYGVDVTRGLNDESFNEHVLEIRELAYAQAMMLGSV